MLSYLKVVKQKILIHNGLNYGLNNGLNNKLNFKSQFATCSQNYITGCQANPKVADHPVIVVGICKKEHCESITMCNCPDDQKKYFEVAQVTHNGSDKNPYPGLSDPKYLMSTPKHIYMRALDSPRELNENLVNNTLDKTSTKKLNIDPETIKKLNRFCGDHLEKINSNKEL